jgi:3'-phosphoadenosine 5'-phosphosulfate sulfotransferase (PAPS reductase)/FAD synthetase
LDLSALDRHEGRIAFAFSGGKDSLACVYLLRDHLHRMTVYHVSTGDQMQEVIDIVDHVRRMAPNFVTLQTDKEGWVRQNGLPSDLVPHSSHNLGQAMNESPVKLVSRYDCCFANLMWPMHQRIKADGNTLVIRGTKLSDMKRVPFRSGEVRDGLELFLPIEGWDDPRVFAYLREVGAPIAPVYLAAGVVHTPECARCSAWLNESLALYLRRQYPAAFADYAARLDAIGTAILPSLQNLARERAAVLEAIQLSGFPSPTEAAAAPSLNGGGDAT